MSSWQEIELDPELHQRAERAAVKAGIPVEQWIERSIRRACPAAFQAPVVAPPLNGFDQALKNRTNGLDPSLAELIAAARVPRQPVAPAPTPASTPAPEVNAAEPSKNILDYMFRRRRRFAGDELPAQSRLEEPPPEQSGDLFDEQPRLKLRLATPAEHDAEPIFAPAAAPHRDDAKAPWPSFKDREAPGEREDFSSPLELTPPLLVDIAIAVVVFIGVLGAQRYLSMIAGKPEPQAQSALDSTSNSAATSMPSLQPSEPPPEQSAAQTSPSSENPAAETPPAAGIASTMPPSAANSQPAAAPPQPMAEADTTNQQNPTPPATTETPPPRKMAAIKPPATHAAPPASTAAKKPVPAPGEESQDPAKLAARLPDRAKTNDPVAQYRLGVLYALG